MPSRRSEAYKANLAPLHVDLTKAERERVNAAIKASGLVAKEWVLRVALERTVPSSLPASVMRDAVDALQQAADLQRRFADLACASPVDRRAGYKAEERRFRIARRALLAHLERGNDA